MKKIAVFCIPAHGHTNPMLPVAEELVRRGDEVRFYSFEDFRKKIEQTGAVYVSCDAYLLAVDTRSRNIPAHLAYYVTLGMGHLDVLLQEDGAHPGV